MKRLTATGACLLAAMASCGSSGDVRPPGLPPVPGAVRDGAGRDVDRQDSLSAVFANWDTFVDPEGRPVTYEWSMWFESSPTPETVKQIVAELGR